MVNGYCPIDSSSGRNYVVFIDRVIVKFVQGVPKQYNVISPGRWVN